MSLLPPGAKATIMRIFLGNTFADALNAQMQGKNKPRISNFLNNFCSLMVLIISP
jgi:hypothetical protein